jgi:aldose 1-epimerase
MAEIITLTADVLEVDLRPAVGGAVTRFDVDGEPLMRRAPQGLHDVLDASCFPLVPFCNRVRDGRFSFRGRQVQLPPNMPGQRHPLHGQGWRAAWSIFRQEPASAILAYRHEPADWPWAYEARLSFALDPDGLTVDLAATNLSDEPMPCGLGLHPYFPCTAQTVLDARVTGVWTVDDEIMPVTHQRATGRYDLHERRICGADLDNGFDAWAGPAVIRWPERSLELTLATVGGARYLQVYAPAAGGVVVVEGVTHANAALNLPEDQWAGAGLKVLEPYETFALTTRFDVCRL